MGERCRGTAEVAGSSPASSIPKDRPSAVTGCDDFRAHFSYWVDRVAAGEEVLVTRRGKPRIRLSPANGVQLALPAHSAHSPEMIRSAPSG